jgi:N-acetylmuramoyl-L-alanine amidase
MTKDSKMPARICIDPGHGGSDTGAEANGLIERDLNLEIACRVEALLDDNGHDVFKTRASNDTSVSLGRRAEMSVTEGADLFVSIHHDAGSETHRGACGFCHWGGHRQDPDPYPNGLDLATQISARVRHHVGVPASYNAIGARPHWYRLGVFQNHRNAYHVTSALIECATLTHPADAAIIKRRGYYGNAALGIYQGIQQHLGLPYSTDHADWIPIMIMDYASGQSISEFEMHPDGNHLADQGKLYVREIE